MNLALRVTPRSLDRPSSHQRRGAPWALFVATLVALVAWGGGSPSAWAAPQDDPPAEQPAAEESKSDADHTKNDKTTNDSSATAQGASKKAVPPKRRSGGIETQLGAALNGLGQANLQAAQGTIANGRQVTLFAIVADPRDRTVDPKLREIEPQLSRSLPNHGFRLVDARNLRLKPGEAILCGLNSEARALLSQPATPGGWPPLSPSPTPVMARAELVSAWTNRGKVEFRLSLLGADGTPRVASLISTPPNQLFFVNNPLPDGGRLLIGLGAR